MFCFEDIHSLIDWMNDRKKSTAVVQGILAHGSPDLFLFMHLQKYIYKCYAWFKKKNKS